MSRQLFIRDDDACTLDKSFRFFFDMAVDHLVPVVYAVIPGRMDKSFIRFLRRAKEKTPHLLDIVQHGWIHTNHSTTGSKKYEFGASRSEKIQEKDIIEGLNHMRSAFGGCFTQAFVPPYHGYDECTLKIINEKDFRIFSAGAPRAGFKKRFIELPAMISFSCYEKGKFHSIHDPSHMIEVIVQDRNKPLSGVVTHHEDFSTVASRKKLERFLGYIKTLMNKKAWQVLLFSDVWRICHD